MSWNKIPSMQVKKPTPPSYFKWGLTICLAFFFLVSFLYTNNNINTETKKKWVTIIIASIPLLIAISTFSFQVIIYIRNKNHYVFLENEKKYADKQWEAWGSRYIGVLECTVLLPERITIPYIIKNKSKHVTSYNIPKNIDYLPKDKSPCFILLRSMQDKILQTSNEHTISVKYVAKKNKNQIKKEFSFAWEQLFSDIKTPQLSITDILNYTYIEESIKENKNIIEIILIEQKINTEQSAALVALMLATDDIAKSHKLNTIANIKRPMPIDVNDDYNSTIKAFSEIQIESQLTTHSFFDGKSNNEILSSIYQLSNDVPKLSPNTTFDLEYFIGPTGEYSPWINTALAIIFSFQQKQASLTLSNEDNITFIGTITSGYSV